MLADDVKDHKERTQNKYHSALPFETQFSDGLPIGEYDLDELENNCIGFSKGFWEERPAYTWEIADEILAKGLAISFKVARSRAAWLAAYVAQAVTTTVIANYDFAVDRLVVAAVLGDDVEK